MPKTSVEVERDGESYRITIDGIYNGRFYSTGGGRYRKYGYRKSGEEHRTLDKSIKFASLEEAQAFAQLLFDLGEMDNESDQ